MRYEKLTQKIEEELFQTLSKYIGKRITKALKKKMHDDTISVLSRNGMLSE